MLFIIVVAAIGLLRRQGKVYWISALAAVGVQFIAGLLFSAGGTLEAPSGDGIITHLVRKATNDGPGVMLLFPLAMVFGWAVPIWIVVRTYKKKSTSPEPAVPNSPRVYLTDAEVAELTTRLTAAGLTNGALPREDAERDAAHALRQPGDTDEQWRLRVDEANRRRGRSK